MVVPDIPGCFSAGDILEQAFENAAEAIEAHCELLAEDDQEMPLPKPMQMHQESGDFDGWTWGVVDVPIAYSK